jgi:hypothetical protein
MQQTLHQWCRKFDHAFANGLRRRQPRPVPGVEHRQSEYLNNRAENSHQTRERVMKKFTSPGHAQRFLSALSGDIIALSSPPPPAQVHSIGNWAAVWRDYYSNRREVICLDHSLWCSACSSA